MPMLNQMTQKALKKSSQGILCMDVCSTLSYHSPTSQAHIVCLTSRIFRQRSVLAFYSTFSSMLCPYYSYRH